MWAPDLHRLAGLGGVASLAIVNAVGYATRVGGSCPHPDVLRAMQWAQEHYFELDDLFAYASETIARCTGAEAGLVTCGASAALTLGAAAILAGDDIAAMEVLPDVSRLPRSVFLYPTPGRYDYDHPVRVSGARLRYFAFEGPGLEERFEAAVSEELAGVVYVWKHREDGEVIRRVATLCRKAGLPFLLDAAMALPPVENLQDLVSPGVSLIALSGGKHLGGPQNSGLLFGETALIRSAWLQMADMDVRAGSWSRAQWLEAGYVPQPPRHGIGRGFKIGKDTVLGVLTALERYPARDFAAERAQWNATCARIATALGGGSAFDVELLAENGTGQYPVVRLRARGPQQMQSLKRRLRLGSPGILLAEDEDDHAVAFIYPMCLGAQETDCLIFRLREAFNDER